MPQITSQIYKELKTRLHVKNEEKIA